MFNIKLGVELCYTFKSLFISYHTSCDYFELAACTSDMIRKYYFKMNVCNVQGVSIKLLPNFINRLLLTECVIHFNLSAALGSRLL